MKRLTPDAKTDKLDELLSCAAGFGRVDVVRYLLDLEPSQMTSRMVVLSALDWCLSTSLRFQRFSIQYSVSETLNTFKLLLEKDAQWRPDEPQEIQWERRNLLECEPDATMELIEQLMKHNACPHDTIHDPLRTPAMKKHLTPVARRFGLIGFDIRTKEQKEEDERRSDDYRRCTIRQLASRYNREKIYEIWSEPIQRDPPSHCRPLARRKNPRPATRAASSLLSIS